MAPFVHAFITLGLLAGTIVTAAPAGAAAPTCDGRMPTIIGSSDQERLYGTDGPDVIVTNGSRIVDAGGGADVVCMTGGDTLVDTGDHYETHQAEAVPMAHDIVIGTGGNDVVYSGREYRGDDAYAASYDNDDDIRLGAGDSTLFMEGRPTGDLDGGDGSDRWWIRAFTDVDWTVDLPAGQVVTGAETGTLRGFEVLDLGRTYWTSLTFRGTDAPEVLLLDKRNRETARVDIDLGAGADSIALPRSLRGTVAGGAGHDEVALDSREVTFSGGAVTATSYPRLALSSFADYRGAAAKVSGDANDNTFVLTSCAARVSGGPGDDRILMRAVGCRPRPATRLIATGGGGDDVLQGGRGADTLIGGPGFDLAVGGRARDDCRAERRRHC